MVSSEIESQACRYRATLLVLLVPIVECDVITTDGQKIAIRLSRRITTITKQLKRLLQEYNSSVATTEQLSWEQAVTCSANQQDSFQPSDIPSHVKHDAVSLHLLIS